MRPQIYCIILPTGPTLSFSLAEASFKYYVLHCSGLMWFAQSRASMVLRSTRDGKVCFSFWGGEWSPFQKITAGRPSTHFPHLGVTMTAWRFGSARAKNATLLVPFNQEELCIEKLDRKCSNECFGNIWCWQLNYSPQWNIPWSPGCVLDNPSVYRDRVVNGDGSGRCEPKQSDVTGSGRDSSAGFHYQIRIRFLRSCDSILHNPPRKQLCVGLINRTSRHFYHKSLSWITTIILTNQQSRLG